MPVLPALCLGTSHSANTKSYRDVIFKLCIFLYTQKDEIAALRKMVEQKSQELTSMSSLLKEKDNKIKDLQDELKKKDDEVQNKDNELQLCIEEVIRVCIPSCIELPCVHVLNGTQASCNVSYVNVTKLMALCHDIRAIFSKLVSHVT